MANLAAGSPDLRIRRTSQRPRVVPAAAAEQTLSPCRSLGIAAETSSGKHSALRSAWTSMPGRVRRRTPTSQTPGTSLEQIRLLHSDSGLPYHSRRSNAYYTSNVVRSFHCALLRPSEIFPVDAAASEPRSVRLPKFTHASPGVPDQAGPDWDEQGSGSAGADAAGPLHVPYLRVDAAAALDPD